MTKSSKAALEAWAEGDGIDLESDSGKTLIVAIERLHALGELDLDDHGVPFWLGTEEGVTTYLFEDDD